ncbi:MAG: hypothetical protein JWO06_1763 [Bacteroidota bacterium]|nr:hypothetical protein [Bacteroidota bacterium]
MASSQGTMNKAFVSAIDFLDQREIDPNLYDVSRDRSLTDIMKLVDRRKPIETGIPNYHNFVNNNVYETGTISAVTSTGLAQIQFTISTGSTFPRVTDLFRSNNVNNAGQQGLVTAVTPGSGTATITVRSVAGNTAPLYATVGDLVTFSGNAQSESSGAPTNRRYGVTKYFNKVQIFREVDEITDVQKVAKIEITTPGGDYGMLPIQHIYKVVKLNADISAQMIAGVQSSTSYGDANPFLSIGGNPVQTTGGLNWYVTTYGIVNQAAVLGTFGFTELDSIVDSWLANKAPKDQMGFIASKAKGILDVFFKNLGSSGVNSVRMVIDGKTVDMQVDHISYRGCEIDFVYLPILDHPQIFGTLSPDITGSIYFVPKDQIEVVGGGTAPRMQIRYTPSPFMGANGSSDGVMKEWRTGALAEIPTNSTANLHTDWYTEQGLECLGVQLFQKFRVV